MSWPGTNPPRTQTKPGRGGGIVTRNQEAGRLLLEAFRSDVTTARTAGLLPFFLVYFVVVSMWVADVALAGSVFLTIVGVEREGRVFG